MRAILIAAALLTSTAPAAALAQTATLSAAPAAASQAAATPATAPLTAFERDRQSILAQAGQYRVRFDMRETVSFREGYEPLEQKLSGGNEIVRVIADTGRTISLQHILVMEHDGQSMVIKHWRQDWTYEPATVLTYAGPDTWTLTPVTASERAGAWSQTVWQTDDSPRYGGVGRWSYANGLAEWTSNATWRPLARRDAVRSPVYDRYLGTNRHALTPFGWVHIQDNMKMAPPANAQAEPSTVVQEDVVNTYRKWDGYDASPGDRYWAATKDYWASVRADWDAAVAAHNGVHVKEVADTGAVTGTPLMDLAQQIADGKTTTAAAIPQARAIIAEATTETSTAR